MQNLVLNNFNDSNVCLNVQTSSYFEFDVLQFKDNLSLSYEDCFYSLIDKNIEFTFLLRDKDVDENGNKKDNRYRFVIKILGYECTVAEIYETLSKAERNGKHILDNIITPILLVDDLDESLRNLRIIEGSNEKYNIRDVESNNEEYYLNVEKDFSSKWLIK